MSAKQNLLKFLTIFLVVSPLVLNGCSYIPWIGDDDEDDLAFEEDFPFEDEQNLQKASTSSEDEFFAEDSSLIDSGGGDSGFSSLDPSADANELKGDVQSLQSQQEALISKVRELEEILITLEPKVSATQERLEGSLSAASSQSEFLEPEVEELKRQVAMLNDELTGLKSGRGGPAKSRGMTRMPAKAGGQTPPEYKQALDAYNSGNYDESILLFQNFALSNPPSSLKDNILYWIGSNYVKLEMYDDAIKQFDTLLHQYPNGNKAHDSRLMMGVSYYKKGESSRAVDVLETALKYNPPADVRGKILSQLNEIQ